MKTTSKYRKNKIKSRLGALLPIALFLIVSIASLTPLLIHNSEQSAERGIYNGEWAKIQWGLNGLKNAHVYHFASKSSGENPSGATTVATISYGDFHVTAKIMERKTLMSRNECFSMTPMVYRGTGASSNPYRDAGYNLEEITVTYDSMPGVAAGGNSSFAWKKDGYLYAWGSNGTKQLGVGDDTSNRTSPVSVEQGSLPSPKKTKYNNGWLVATGLSSSLIVDYAGNLYETGKVNNTSNYSKSPLLNTNPNLKQGVLDVAVGDQFMVVIPDDEERRPLMKSWQPNSNKKIDGGTNSFESLKIESTTVIDGTSSKKIGVEGTIGVSAGNRHYIAMTSGGYLWGVGDNSDYQLGHQNQNATYTLINDVTEIREVANVPYSGSSEMTVSSNNTIFTIANKYLISTFTVRVDNSPKEHGVVWLYEKKNAVIKLVNINTNDISELNIGTSDFTRTGSDGRSGDYIWTYQDRGQSATAVILEAGTYRVEVYNSKRNIIRPEEYFETKWRKNNALNMGVYSFHGKQLDDTSFVGVAAGDNFSMAIARETENDILHIWGTNDRGQLGLNNSNIEKEYSMTVVPNFPPNNTRIKNIVAGNKHAMALLDNGDLYVWGDNSSGQLGINNPSVEITYVTKPTIVPKAAFGGNKIISIAAGYNHSLAMDEDLNVYSWGNESHGKLGRTGSNSIPAQVTVFPAPDS